MPHSVGEIAPAGATTVTGPSSLVGEVMVVEPTHADAQTKMLTTPSTVLRVHGSPVDGVATTPVECVRLPVALLPLSDSASDSSSTESTAAQQWATAQLPSPVALLHVTDARPAHAAPAAALESATPFTLSSAASAPTAASTVAPVAAAAAPACSVPTVPSRVLSPSVSCGPHPASPGVVGSSGPLRVPVRSPTRESCASDFQLAAAAQRLDDFSDDSYESDIDDADDEEDADYEVPDHSSYRRSRVAAAASSPSARFTAAAGGRSAQNSCHICKCAAAADVEHVRCKCGVLYCSRDRCCRRIGMEFEEFKSLLRDRSECVHCAPRHTPSPDDAAGPVGIIGGGVTCSLVSTELSASSGLVVGVRWSACPNSNCQSKKRKGVESRPYNVGIGIVEETTTTPMTMPMPMPMHDADKTSSDGADAATVTVTRKRRAGSATEGWHDRPERGSSSSGSHTPSRTLSHSSSVFGGSRPAATQRRERASHSSESKVPVRHAGEMPTSTPSVPASSFLSSAFLPPSSLSVGGGANFHFTQSDSLVSMGAVSGGGGSGARYVEHDLGLTQEAAFGQYRQVMSDAHAMQAAAGPLPPFAYPPHAMSPTFFLPPPHGTAHLSPPMAPQPIGTAVAHMAMGDARMMHGSAAANLYAAMHHPSQASNIGMPFHSPHDHVHTGQMRATMSMMTTMPLPTIGMSPHAPSPICFPLSTHGPAAAAQANEYHLRARQEEMWSHHRDAEAMRRLEQQMQLQHRHQQMQLHHQHQRGVPHTLMHQHADASAQTQAHRHPHPLLVPPSHPLVRTPPPRDLAHSSAPPTAKSMSAVDAAQTTHVQKPLASTPSVRLPAQTTRDGSSASAPILPPPATAAAAATITTVQPQPATGTVESNSLASHSSSSLSTPSSGSLSSSPSPSAPPASSSPGSPSPSASSSSLPSSFHTFLHDSRLCLTNAMSLYLPNWSPRSVADFLLRHLRVPSAICDRVISAEVGGDRLLRMSREDIASTLQLDQTSREQKGDIDRLEAAVGLLRELYEHIHLQGAAQRQGRNDRGPTCAAARAQVGHGGANVGGDRRDARDATKPPNRIKCEDLTMDPTEADRDEAPTPLR